MFKLSVLTVLALRAASTFAAPSAKDVPAPDAFGKYTLEAPGIRAQFIPYAASITNLFVKDKNGIERDIVLGYDNATYYPIDPGHPNLGATIGRYANRIGNATYSLGGKTYNTDKNDGSNTLHSGVNGWGYRTFEVESVSKSSITFSILDPSNSSNGFPGRVTASVKYTLTAGAWHIRMEAESLDQLTPLMLTQHTYFNLDAYANPETDLIYNHTLYAPYSQRILENGPDTVPTGKIVRPPKGDINDFWSRPRAIGEGIGQPGWEGNCGSAFGCNGYNNFLIVDVPAGNWRKSKLPHFSLRSEWSGITVDAYSNQGGLQVYSCFWSDGSGPLKSTQGGPASNGFVKSDSCIALEAQDWNDGINHPEWKRKQIYGPGEKYVWEAVYKVSASKD